MKLLVEVNVDEAQIEKMNTKRTNAGRQTITAFDLVDNAIQGALKESWVKDVTVSLPDTPVNAMIQAIENNVNGAYADFKKVFG